MKQFFKFTLATIVGILITSIIGIMLFFGVIGVIASSSDEEVHLSENSIYELRLSGVLKEREENDPLGNLLSDSPFTSQMKAQGLDVLLENIKKAKINEHIKGIYLNIEMLSAGYASLMELRNALTDFKQSGKFIVAYADNYTQKTYYLATVADKVFLNPEGILMWQGLSAQTMFLKNTLQKVGVEMQIFKVGTYKSAVEPYILDKMSTANKKQVTQLISSIWGEVLTGVSQSRKITMSQLNEYANTVQTMRRTSVLVENHLIDSLVYQSEVKDYLKELTKTDHKDDLIFVSNKKMANVSEDSAYSKNKIAVIYAVGVIDGMEEDGINSAKLIETINDVEENEKIKAVVLRVNSPGGSAFGSEQIWYALSQLKMEKPLIVSMGDYAASGGYYISCIADTIVAEPSTITGSIGVFGAIPSFGRLYSKIGLTFDGVNTNTYSDFGKVSNRPFNSVESTILQDYVNRTYELFVKRCADGRQTSPDDIKAIAEGRVWTGVDAKANGLVDVLGGLNEAIAIAAMKAGVSEYNIRHLPAKEEFFMQLIKSLETSVETHFLTQKVGEENWRILETVNRVKSMSGVQALMPYELEIR